MDSDIVSQLRNPYYQLIKCDSLHLDAAEKILALRIKLTEAYAREALWRATAIEAQDKVFDLLEQLYKKAVRCDCP